MARFEDFPPDIVETWHNDILDIAGVERVSIVVKDGTTEYLNYPPNHEFRLEAEARGIYADVNFVGERDVRPAVLSYAKDHLPQIKTVHDGRPYISQIDPQTWHVLTNLVDARSLMDYFLGSNHIEAAAKKTHDAWLAGKTVDLLDPANPYHGYDVTRTKVRDLTAAQKLELAIPDTADPDQDVYHPLHLPFIKLAPEAKNRNVVPMAAACLAIGDFLTDDTTTSEQLRQLIIGVARDTDPHTQQLLNMVTHVAWTASDVTQGGRPWTEGGAANYHLYNKLTPAVQDLDTQASAAPIHYMRDEFEPISNAVHELNAALFRENGPYEIWWAKEAAVLKAASGWRTLDGIVPLRDTASPEIPSFKTELADAYRSYTNWRYSLERLAADSDRIIDEALTSGHISHDKTTTEWTITPAGQQRKDDLYEACDSLNGPQLLLNAGRILAVINNYASTKERYSQSA